MAEIRFARPDKVCLFDEEDVPVISQFKWWLYTSRNPRREYSYAFTRVDGKDWLMHRLLLGVPRGVFVDHINGDGLDNRRANLRPCTHAENMRNRRIALNNKSGVKGVHYDLSRNVWKARIQVDGHKFRLGSFKSLEEAKEAYRAAALRLHGEFARFE